MGVVNVTPDSFSDGGDFLDADAAIAPRPGAGRRGRRPRRRRRRVHPARRAAGRRGRGAAPGAAGRRGAGRRRRAGQHRHHARQVGRGGASRPARPRQRRQRRAGRPGHAARRGRRRRAVRRHALARAQRRHGQPGGVRRRGDRGASTSCAARLDAPSARGRRPRPGRRRPGPRASPRTAEHNWSAAGATSTGCTCSAARCSSAPRASASWAGCSPAPTARRGRRRRARTRPPRSSCWPRPRAPGRAGARGARRPATPYGRRGGRRGSSRVGGAVTPTPRPGRAAGQPALYDAFESADLDLMTRALGCDGPEAGSVACVHPGWPPLHGRGVVLRSWALIMANTPYIQFVLTDLEARVTGDVAVVTCGRTSSPPAGRRDACPARLRRSAAACGGDQRLPPDGRGLAALAAPRLAGAAPATSRRTCGRQGMAWTGDRIAVQRAPRRPGRARLCSPARSARLGQEFVVDVVLPSTPRPAAASDDVADTVHYGELAAGWSRSWRASRWTCWRRWPSGSRTLPRSDPRVDEVEVTVHKPEAPVPRRRSTTSP